jgi:hypothetical protein
MIYLWQVIRYIFLMIMLVSCSKPQSTRPTLMPPAAFRDSHIIGRWETFNANGYSEVLVLNADSSFTQTYKLSEKSLHVERSGTWRVEHRASGCIYLHLEGMYYFHGGSEVADNGNRLANGDLYRFQELCEYQPITMPDKVILSVVEFPVSLGTSPYYFRYQASKVHLCR